MKGVAIAGLPYIGGQNGQTVPETGFAGAKSGGPINKPWIALSDLGAGDAQVYVGRGGADGSFDIKNVPDGTYQLTIWDDDQDYILWSFNVEVRDGGVTDVGNKMIVGWFTHLHGTSSSTTTATAGGTRVRRRSRSSRSPSASATTR